MKKTSNFRNAFSNLEKTVTSEIRNMPDKHYSQFRRISYNIAGTFFLLGGGVLTYDAVLKYYRGDNPASSALFASVIYAAAALNYIRAARIK
jgi:hypothetical protein